MSTERYYNIAAHETLPFVYVEIESLHAQRTKLRARHGDLLKGYLQ